MVQAPTPNIKLCPVCGLQAAIDAPTCAQCGHQYRTQFAPPPGQTMAYVSCPACGALVAGGSPKCAQCGRQMIGSSPPAPNPYDRNRPTPSGPYMPPGYHTHVTTRSGMPSWAGFLIGVILPVVGIILGILFLTVERMRDPLVATSALIGAAVGTILTYFIWGSLLGGFF